LNSDPFTISKDLRGDKPALRTNAKLSPSASCMPGVVKLPASLAAFASDACAPTFSALRPHFFQEGPRRRARPLHDQERSADRPE
jgi:hypothetical protein